MCSRYMRIVSLAICDVMDEQMLLTHAEWKAKEEKVGGETSSNLFNWRGNGKSHGCGCGSGRSCDEGDRNNI